MRLKDKLLQLGIEAFKKSAEYHTFLPRYTGVETTKACNIKCVGCRRNTYSYTLSKEPGPQHLTVKDLQDIIGSCPVKVVAFEGDGEPLCNPHFSSLLEWCSSRGIRSAVQTNATLVDEYWVSKFKRYGMSRVHVSIDGASKGTYEKWRVGADYDKVVWASGLLGKSGIQLFLSCVLFSDEIIDELPQYLDLARKVGAVGIHLMWPQYEEPSSNCVTPRDVSGLIKKAKGERFIVTGLFYGLPTFIGCRDAYIKPTIILGGDVYPCSCSANLRRYESYGGKKLPIPYQNFRMGNAHETSLRDIWKGEAYKELRQTLKDIRRPRGTTISRGELLNMKENAGDNRFSFCRGCSAIWSEGGL